MAVPVNINSGLHDTVMTLLSLFLKKVQDLWAEKVAWCKVLVVGVKFSNDQARIFVKKKKFVTVYIFTHMWFKTFFSHLTLPLYYLYNLPGMKLDIIHHLKKAINIWILVTVCFFH